MLKIKEKVKNNKDIAELNQKSPKYSAPALDKGIDIIELLVNSKEGMTMGEIAINLGRNVSEIFRMLVTLEKRGWIASNEADKYYLTTRMLELAHHHTPNLNISEAAILPMQKLARETMQSCHLSIIENGRIIVILQVEAPGRLSFGVRVGSMVELFNTASGLILLSFRTPEERERLISEHALVFGEMGGMQRNIWEKEVDKVCKNGYSLFPSQQVRGVTNIGYPIWNSLGKVTAALVIPYLEGLGATKSISLEATRIQLGKAAEQITKNFGFNRIYTP